MRILQLAIFLLFMLSCKTTRITKYTAAISTSEKMQKHGDCFVTYLNEKNQKNDTLTIKILRTVFFDTTAIFIHGTVLDYNTPKPISNADVELFSLGLKFTTNTNSNGEFELFENLRDGAWNIKISHKNYSCLYIVNAVQAGGEWLEIKLRSK